MKLMTEFNELIVKNNLFLIYYFDKDGIKLHYMILLIILKRNLVASKELFFFILYFFKYLKKK